MQIINVKNEYYKNKKLGSEVIVPNGFNYKLRNPEIEIVKIIKDEFGGAIELLNEINVTGYKNPDFSWENKLWEIKSVSTKNSVDSQVRYALKQISNDVGGIVLILDRCILTITEIIDIVAKRVKRTSFKIIPEIDVILMRNFKVIDVIRVKKDIPSAK